MSLFTCLECGGTWDDFDKEDWEQSDCDNCICLYCIKDPGWREREAEKAMKEMGLLE